MNRTLLSLLAVAALAGPAFATHPNEVCRIRIDTAALAKSKGAEPGPVKIRYFFRTYMTDMNPSEPQVAPPPQENPDLYKADVYSCPYYRTLASIEVVSVATKPDGTPLWTAAFQRPDGDAKSDGKAAPPISCETYAD